MDNLCDIFKILSDESRLRVVMLLYRERLCVCQLSGVLGLSQPRVSKALSKLRDVGLVKDVRQDRFVFYSLVEVEGEGNGLLGLILGGVVANIGDYPVLVEDFKRLGFKEDLLDGCVVPVSID